jgi:hypothetical protein
MVVVDECAWASLRWMAWEHMRHMLKAQCGCSDCEAQEAPSEEEKVAV